MMVDMGVSFMDLGNVGSYSTANMQFHAPPYYKYGTLDVMALSLTMDVTMHESTKLTQIERFLLLCQYPING